MCSVLTELWAQLQRARWIAWVVLLGSSLWKKANGMSPGSCCEMERGRGRWRNEVDVKRSRQELRDMAQQQNTSVCGMVPFLSYKSCSADTILSSIILPPENPSSCTICQPVLSEAGDPCAAYWYLGCTFIWNHSIICASPPAAFDRTVKVCSASLLRILQRLDLKMRELECVELLLLTLSFSL